MQRLIAHDYDDHNDPTASFPSLSHNFIILKSLFIIGFFEIFPRELVCLFLVPISAHSSVHARQVLKFVVSKF